ncbi:hypothetical protein ACFWYQ_21280 [[Kitasatospora] papulosa]|uniref:hypothetical protein n=1 Tax=[Kitasatospora] papulosa TaxID=1464011 RepID=UPI00367B9AC6
MSPTPTNPADLLRKAADRLREAAGHATPGPWRTHDTHLDLGGHTATVLSGERNETQLLAWLPTMSHESWDETRNAWRNAGWMALMDPSVGLAVAAWLEAEAAAPITAQHSTRCVDPQCTTLAALTVARRVLGTATGQPATAPWPPAGDQRPDHKLYTLLRRVGLAPEAAQQEIDTYTRAILARQGAPAVDRATVLTPAEGHFLAFALDQAAEELSLGAGFTVEAAAALDRLRRLAAEAQQPTPAETEEPTPCGNTQGLGTANPYKPCARPAGHPEAYCKDATGDHLFLPATTTPATEEPK